LCLRHCSRTAQERVNDHYTIKLLVRLEIFCQQVTRRSRLRSGDNQRVPEREQVAILDFPASFENSVIHANWPPRQQVSDLGAGLLPRLRPFPGDLDVKFLQDLKADSPPTALPERCPPGARRLLLLRVSFIKRVNQDIRINEDWGGRGLPRATGIVRPSSRRVSAREPVAWRVRSYSLPPSALSRCQPAGARRSSPGERPRVWPNAPRLLPRSP
jgi:hypothetical protein